MMLLEHPMQFFLALFIATLGLGAYLDRLYVGWRIKRLKTRLELELAWRNWRPGR